MLALACFLFIQFRFSAQRIAPSTVDQTSHSVNLVKIVPHRRAQGPVSWVFPDVTRLTIEMNSHTGISSDAVGTQGWGFWTILLGADFKGRRRGKGGS